MADNLKIKDGDVVDRVLKTTDNGGVHTPHQNVDTVSTITNVVHVDDNSASLTVDGTVVADGAAADDAPASGNPVRVGGKSVNALPAAAANNDAVDLLTDLQRRLLTLPYANPENTVYGNPAAVTDDSAHDIISSQGAGTKIYVTSVLVTNSHATVGTLVTIQDDTAGTPIVICQGYAASMGGGFSLSMPVPRATGANKKLQVVCDTTGANVYVSVAGFKAA